MPIIINGIDASYAVVEGDWGLGKDVHVQPTIYGGRYVDPVPNVGHYYPSAGHLPGYGRLEIEPPANRKLPQPAESYHQSWSAQSTPQPVQPEVPLVSAAGHLRAAGWPAAGFRAGGRRISSLASRRSFHTRLNANKKQSPQERE